MAQRQKFIDLAIEYSTDYGIDMVIKDRTYFIEVIIYYEYRACSGDETKILSELIGMSDKIYSFDGTSLGCDFTIILDYNTHDQYMPRREING